MVVSIVKNIFQIVQLSIKKISNRLNLPFKDNKFYNFCITIFKSNSINLVFLKNS